MADAPKIMQDEFSITRGGSAVFRLIWADPLSPDDKADLLDWLKLVERRIQHKAEGTSDDPLDRCKQIRERVAELEAEVQRNPKRLQLATDALLALATSDRVTLPQAEILHGIKKDDDEDQCTHPEMRSVGSSWCEDASCPLRAAGVPGTHETKGDQHG